MEVQKLSRVIRSLIDEYDKCGAEIDPDRVLRKIQQDFKESFAHEGDRLARTACRRLITGELRRMSAMDVNDSDEDIPQLQLPGLERLPTHVMYHNCNGKPVARHVMFATLAEHRACLALKRQNTMRCLEREAQEERVIDLLEASQCDTLEEWRKTQQRAA